MASASDWYTRALGKMRAPAPPPPPGSTASLHYAALAPGAPYAPAQQPQPQPHGYTTYDANTGAQVADDGHVAMLIQAAESTGGSKRVRENSGICPECASPNYFARAFTENGMPMRMPAAPRCYDCGYPVVQAGSARGGATSARRSGPAQRARQLPASHTVTMLDGSVPVSFPPSG